VKHFVDDSLIDVKAEKLRQGCAAPLDWQFWKEENHSANSAHQLLTDAFADSIPPSSNGSKRWLNPEPAIAIPRSPERRITFPNGE
jgi:hypothetical protein